MQSENIHVAHEWKAYQNSNSLVLFYSNFDAVLIFEIYHKL